MKSGPAEIGDLVSGHRDFASKHTPPHARDAGSSVPSSGSEGDLSDEEGRRVEKVGAPFEKNKESAKHCHLSQPIEREGPRYILHDLR